MKKISILIGALLVTGAIHAQVTKRIVTDSLLLTNDSCNAELILENSTKNISGYLFNKGNGRTGFRKIATKINDSVYVLGTDTLFLGFPRRFGFEDNRATENRVYSGNNNSYLILDSTLFGVRGRDSASPLLPASLQGPGTRMFFFTRKAAFRAGTVSGSEWDTASIGFGSAAFGYNSSASGQYSFAGGSARATNTMSNAFGTTTASAAYSLAAGDSAVASGAYCVALGQNAGAYSNYVVAIGRNAIAGLQGAVAIGNGAYSVGFYATAYGLNARCNADYTGAFGVNALTAGGSSFVLGGLDTAISGLSTVMGYRNKTRTGYQLVVGKYNDTADGKNLFSVAYGAAHNSRKNVFTVDTSGKTVVAGTVSPTSWLHVNGSFAAPATTINSDLTLDNQYYTLLVDATGGNVTVTLPSASACAGRMYMLKLISSSNNMVIQRSGSNTIDGATSVTVSTQWQTVQVQSNGTNWYVTGG